MRRHNVKRAIWQALLAWWVTVGTGWAWGPHHEIGVAGARALASNDPFRVYIQNDINAVGYLSWLGDVAAGGGIWSLREMKFYARDCFLPALVPGRGHGIPGDEEAYERLFRRTVQAMRMETMPNFLGWLGGLLHATEDTGAPPHAMNISGERHVKMENWVNGALINIEGYTPRLLGRTEDEALAGYLERMKALRAFVIPRAEKIVPLADANDRAAVEPLVLECALESARAVADLLHTLGALQQKLQPQPGTGTLRGTIQSPSAPGAELIPAKVMLMDTPWSTLADLQGRYEFRGLPAGEYRIIAMRPGATPGRGAGKVAAGETTTLDLSLAAADPPGNLLRNGDFSVRWMERLVPADWAGPDGWRMMSRPATNWFSEDFQVRTGQVLRLTVRWKPRADGEVVLTWRDAKGTAEPPLRAPESSRAVRVPAGLEGFQNAAYLRIQGGGAPWEMMERVGVALEQPPAPAPAVGAAAGP